MQFTIVNTLNDLRQLSTKNFSLVQTLGIASPNGGFGSLYWSNLSDTRPDNGTTIIAPVDNLGRWNALVGASVNGVPLNGSQSITIPPLYNKFINPNMEVDQRNGGAAQTITAGAALAYTVDRWYAYCTGANVTGQQVAGTGITRKVYQFTGAASVTGIGFGQRIESVNCYEFNGTTATLNVLLSNSLLGTVTWTASYANSTDSFGTIALPTVTQIATGTFTVTSTDTVYSTQIAIPVAATTGIEVRFTVGAQTSGTWRIGDVYFTGPNYVGKEKRLYPVEFSLCQRYLPSFNSQGTNDPIGYGYSFSTTSTEILFSFQVPPRVKPSGITTSALANFNLVNGSNIAGTPTAITLDSAGICCSNLGITTTAGSPTLTAGQGARLQASNTSAQILFTGCEL